MASQDAVEFISRMEKGRASVHQLLQSESSACIVRNRAILKSILKAIVFCLKTYLRSTIRLCGLALMHINYSMELDLDEIINIFARKYPRRMVLGDVFSDL